MNDFSEHPVSLSEIRAEKEHSAKLWSPRDVLISMLRDIDAKKINPTTLFVAYGETIDENTRTNFAVSASGNYEALGCVTRAIWMFHNG